MKNKGFTLIELLAVIVILAIIALIAIPIVINIIKSVKDSALSRSVDFYLDAVEQATMEKNMTKEEGFNPKYCKVNKEGNLICKGYNYELEIKVDGKKPIGGKIVLEDGKAYYLSLNYVDKKIEKGGSVLIAGEEFSKNIKDLVNETTNSTAKSEYNKITYIGFYRNKLPEGFTKETLEKLPNIVVSKDNKVKAYNDNGKIYVYGNTHMIADESMYSMFRAMKALTKIDLLELDTSEVKNMRSLFYESSNITSLDLSNFDTSSANTMYAMFYGLSSLTSLDLSNFDTSGVDDMSAMFSGMRNITSLDLSNFDTFNVNYMYNMFHRVSSLEILDLSNFNTTNVTDMHSMFYEMESLTNLDISSFDTIKVTNMDKMFKNTPLLTQILVSNKWVIGSSTTTDNMFTLSGVNSVTLVN